MEIKIYTLGASGSGTTTLGRALAARLARLKQREFARYGARIQPGGDMHRQHEDFLDWARKYGYRRIRCIRQKELFCGHLCKKCFNRVCGRDPVGF